MFLASGLWVFVAESAFVDAMWRILGGKPMQIQSAALAAFGGGDTVSGTGSPVGGWRVGGGAASFRVGELAQPRGGGGAPRGRGRSWSCPFGGDRGCSWRCGLYLAIGLTASGVWRDRDGIRVRRCFALLACWRFAHAGVGSKGSVSR